MKEEYLIHGPIRRKKPFNLLELFYGTLFWSGAIIILCALPIFVYYFFHSFNLMSILGGPIFVASIIIVDLILSIGWFLFLVQIIEIKGLYESR